MIKRFVVVFIVTDIMCRHSPLQLFHDLMDLMDSLWLRYKDNYGAPICLWF